VQLAGPAKRLQPNAGRTTETKMNYLLYPFVLAFGMFVAILSATSATL